MRRIIALRWPFRYTHGMNRLFSAGLIAVLMLAQLGTAHAAVCSNLNQTSLHRKGHCPPAQEQGCGAGQACKQICDASMLAAPAQKDSAKKIQLDWIQMPVGPVSNPFQAFSAQLEVAIGVPPPTSKVPIFLRDVSLLN